jgi:hypothetical protein
MKTITSMKARAAIFAIITVVILLVLYFWRGPEIYYLPHTSGLPDPRPWPPPNVLGSTWYGPVLLLLIPIGLGWIGLAAKNLAGKITGQPYSSPQSAYFSS